MFGRTSAKRELSSRGHRVALVEYDQLYSFAHQLLRAAERLDLLTHDVDAAVVRGVQLR